MKYNSHHTYNKRINKDGMGYNNCPALVNITDSLSFNESVNIDAEIFLTQDFKFWEQMRSKIPNESTWHKMDYNMRYFYNKHINVGGLCYNSGVFRVIIKIFEPVRVKDDSEFAGALIRLTEKYLFDENIVIGSEVKLKDEFYFDLEYTNQVVFEMLEKFHITEETTELLVLFNLIENQKIIDEISELFVHVDAGEDDFSLEDYSHLDALISLADKYKLTEASKLFSLIDEYETFYLLDREPRKAISDFLIGRVAGFDSAFEWFEPFDMMVDKTKSTFQVMPQTESDYIEMPGVDGSVPEYTIYKNRMFNIVAYSVLGLTSVEKEILKAEITRILDSTKNQTKKLTIQSASVSFDVKYSGAADIAEGPSFVRATIPLEASPYGFPLFEQEIFGSGVLMNRGQADVGFVNIISAGAVNPSFRVGKITYSWKGTVPKGSSLYIDHEAYMCYLQYETGTRTNVLSQLTGEFQKIPKETSVPIVANAATEKYLFTKLKEKILWNGGDIL